MMREQAIAQNNGSGGSSPHNARGIIKPRTATPLDITVSKATWIATQSLYVIYVTQSKSDD
jgi:hypothetical protein